MECTPCATSLEKCLRCDRDGLFVAAMKPSTNTPTRFVFVTAAFSLCLGFSVLYAITCSSKGCYGMFNSCNSASITSLAISDAAQKKGGGSQHPIPNGCCSLGLSVLSGCFQLSLLVRPLALWEVPYCVAVVGSHFWFGRGFGSSAASCFRRFVPDPFSYVSAPPSILGVGRVVITSDGFLADLPWWGRSFSVFCGCCRLSLMVPPRSWLA